MSLAVASLALLLVACSQANSLTVQLQSDLVAGAEVDLVEVALTDTNGASVATRTLELTSGRNLGRPVRIAEILDLAAGTYDVRVTLSLGGALVQSRPARTRVSGATFLTLLITRDCNGVICPGAGDATATACLGGRCVSPECTEETPELCGPPACTGDAECAPGSVACVVGSCSASGACFTIADDEACEGELVCDPTSGCVEPAACGSAELPPFVSDCADAVIVSGDMDGDGLPDRRDPDPSVCNPLLSLVERTDRPDAPWSDPTHAECTWEDGDATEALLSALGSEDLGVIVRARFVIDRIDDGGSVGVAIEAGGLRTCEAFSSGGTPSVRVGGDGSPVTGSAGFPIVGAPVVIQISRSASAPTDVVCSIDPGETPTPSSNLNNGLSTTAPTVGFEVHGASVTIDYVAVFAR